MSSQTAVAQFTFSWKIEWTEFKELSTKDITKYFVTACKNVAFYWRIELSCTKENNGANRFSLFMYYSDGPVAELKDLHYSVDLMKSDKSIKAFATPANFPLGKSFGWKNFDENDVESFKNKHSLNESEPFYYRVILKIPISIFSFFENSPAPVESTPWSRTCFKQIEDPEKALFSNAKLISKEGTIFYCHEVVLAYQSEVLAAMFRHTESKDIKKGEYILPALSTGGLRALLEFLYTGQATLTDMATKEILEAADAAEQYGLKILKQMCLAHLWKRVVEKREDCFSVIRFSDLHGDWKYLKHRAMDVLTENFEKMGLESMNLKTQFGGGERGERLRKEFTLYACRRLESFSP